MGMTYFRGVSWLMVAVGLWGCNGKAGSEARAGNDGGLLPDGSAGMTNQEADATMPVGDDSGAGGGGNVLDGPEACDCGDCESDCQVYDADIPPSGDSCGLHTLDAGEFRTCSDSILKPVSLEMTYPEDGGATCRLVPLTERCPLTWGCEDFTTAKADAALCDNGRYRGGEYVGSGWGYQIIGGWFGLSNILSFYDDNTGALVGYWEQDDVGQVICSGTIPQGASAEFGVTRTEELCTPDGGPLGIIDAGDAGDGG
jgi:hypothetical protein